MKGSFKLGNFAGIGIFIYWKFSLLITYIIFSSYRAGHNTEQIVLKAENYQKKAMKNLKDIKSAHAIAYTIKGLYFYHSVYPNAFIDMYINKFAQQFLERFNVNSEEGWYWYEDYMTYANNVLPEAIMYSNLNNSIKWIK